MSPRPKMMRPVFGWAKSHVRAAVGPVGLNDPPRDPLGIAEVVAQRATCAVSRPSGRLAQLPEPPVFDLIAVYRGRNAGVADPLVRETTGTAALWALDKADATLAGSTVGVGPGTRFENLNRCLSATDPSHWLVVADDDVQMSLGTLRQALSLAHAAQLDISMPSHDVDSFVNWDVTRCRPASMVRLCRFVDQGPLLVLSPRARAAVLPFPEETGMGWGVEVGWASDDSLRIGIMDGVRMRHLTPVSGGNYDVDAEWAQAVAMLHRSRWRTWRDLQEVTQRWRWSRRPPPWVSRASGSQVGARPGSHP